MENTLTSIIYKPSTRYNICALTESDLIIKLDILDICLSYLYIEINIKSVSPYLLSINV